MRRIAFAILLVGLVQFSCKKDRLNGDAAILVGEWEWQYSEKTWNVCNPPSFTDSLHFGTENSTFQLKFQEKGNVSFIENSIEVNKYWIDLELGENNGGNSNFDFSFTIYLDGTDQKLGGYVGQNLMMVVDGYPFTDTDCVNYTSYFIRK